MMNNAAAAAASSNPLTTTAAAQTTSLERLHCVEKRIVHSLELAGSVMEELAAPVGPRMESVNNQCREFMQSIKDIQHTLREEIKNMPEYRPYSKCDYASRTAAEIGCKKLDCVIAQLDDMEATIDQYNSK